MHSMHPVLLKQKRLQVASEGGTVEIRVSQFFRLFQVAVAATTQAWRPYVFSWNLGATSKLRLAEQRCCHSATWATSMHSSDKWSGAWPWRHQQGITTLWLVYCFIAKAHVRKPLAQGSSTVLRLGFEPATCWLQVHHSNHSATEPQVAEQVGCLENDQRCIFCHIIHLLEGALVAVR